MSEGHAHAVETVILGGDNKRLANAVPIERGVQDRFQEIAVWIMICPMALALKAGQNGVMAQRLFAETQLCQARIANHQVANNDRAFDDEIPFPVLALPWSARFVV